MRRVDGLQCRVAVKVNLLVVIGHKAAQGEEEKATESVEMFFHKVHELIAVNGKPAPQQEDEEVMEHPIIEAVHQKRFENAVIGQAVNVEVEGCIKARPLVKGHLQNQQDAQTVKGQATYYGNPKGHQEIEPQENDHEVELILGIAEEQDG